MKMKPKYVNTSKYKHKNMHSKPQNINYEEYKQVWEFKYLASLLIYNNDCGRDIQARVTAGSQGYQAVSKIVNQDIYQNSQN
jgi:hypothetical protein